MRDVFLKISTASDFKKLGEICYDYFAEHGVCQLSYLHFPPLGAVDADRTKIIVWLGYPEAWVEAYRANGYIKNDPMIERLANSTQSFRVDIPDEGTELGVRVEKYLELRRKCKTPLDYGVPVFGPNGRNGGFGIGFYVDREAPTDVQMAEMQTICQRAHLRYCELLVGRLPKMTKLSLRESQVLKLIARGLSNRQVASELSVSGKTVETYLARIFDKLEVSDRMTAALRAGAMGLLA